MITCGNDAPKNAGREVKVVEILETAEKQARSELADQPKVLAAILNTVGNTYNNLAQHEPAERNLRDALGLHEKFSDKNNQIMAAECAGELADVLLVLNRAAEAEPLARQAVEIQRRFQPEINRSLAVSLIQLGRGLIKKGDDQTAKPFLRQGYEKLKAALGEQHRTTQEAFQRIGQIR